MVIYDFVAVFRRADAVERRRKELAANKYKWLLSKTALQRDHSLYTLLEVIKSIKVRIVQTWLIFLKTTCQ